MSNKTTGEKIVFISFASQERDLAVCLQNFIHRSFSNRVEVFVSDTSITAGEFWENQIEEKITQAGLVLVLCSPLSVKRQWINFEFGAASMVKGCHIRPLFLFGLRNCDSVRCLKLGENSGIDAHHPEFGVNVLDAVKIALEPEIDPANSNAIDFFIRQWKPIVDDMVRKFDCNEEKERAKKREENTLPRYLLASLTETGGFIEITRCGTSDPVDIDCKIGGDWLKKVKKMNKFLSDPVKNCVCGVGLAIGIQNCLFDNGKIYVGLKMKSLMDAYASKMGIAKRGFNTGYELLSKDSHLKIQAKDNIQDLFVPAPKHIKQWVAFQSEIYCQMEKRVNAAAGRIWRLRFPDGQEAIATIFINHSAFFPRFEIGVWKFIDISLGTFKDREKLDSKGIIAGFGEDIFMDYRGRENEEDTPVNYWIWVRDGEICYWSYPEERLIPRNRPAKHYEVPMHGVLVKKEHMINSYNNPVRYTPFTSDHNLRAHPDAVLKELFSLPARALASCF